MTRKARIFRIEIVVAEQDPDQATDAIHAMFEPHLEVWNPKDPNTVIVDFRYSELGDGTLVEIPDKGQYVENDAWAEKEKKEPEKQKHYGTFTAGQTPEAIILQAMKEGGDAFLMSLPRGSTECNLMVSVVNQGIDSHLQAFTASSFGFGRLDDPNRLDVLIVGPEMPILLRRLWEMGEGGNQDAADFRSGVLEALGIEEI